MSPRVPKVEKMTQKPREKAMGIMNLACRAGFLISQIQVLEDFFDREPYSTQCCRI